MKPHLSVAMAATTIVLTCAVLTQAAPRGPAFGNNRYATEIRNVRGEVDVDDYVAPLVAGERLSVTVNAARKSDLRPEVTILRPDGTVVAATPRTRKGGRGVAIKKLDVDASGPWTVRVAGAAQTEGAYSVAFKVATARPQRWKKQTLGGGDPLERTHVVEAVDGATVDLALRWRRSDTPVRMRALRDPPGRAVPGSDGPLIAEAVTKKTKSILKRAVLGTGDGGYELDVGIPDGRARYALTAKVRPTGRPAGRRPTKLDADEPWLAPRAAPLRGVAGRAVVVQGAGFAQTAPPSVLFDGAAGTSVVVGVGGTSLSVVPPAGAEGSTTELAVVNPDGQAASRDGYFHYAPPPVLTDLLRPGGAAARGGATQGGQPFRIVGEHLHPEQSVLFGASAATLVGDGDSGALDVLSPPATPGLVAIAVVDPYGRSSISEFRFEYKLAPSFDDAPYDPPFGGSAEAVTVTATGDGFSASDVLLFDGESIDVTVLDATRIRFELPPLALGDHDVVVRDRVGTEVIAPVFTVKGPPSITSVTPVDGAYSGADGVPLLGGAVVEVSGASFHALDVVTLGGEEVDVAERSFSGFRFLSPAGALGTLDLEVTDAAGQSDTVADALRRIGFVDRAAARVPAASSVDDLSAWRGAIGDLDGDGASDDVVIVSYGVNKDNVARGNRGATSGTVNAPGTREERTRVLIGDAAGVLADETGTRVPVKGADPTGRDDWNGMAVAIGDLDGGNGPEIVVGGVSPDYTSSNDVRIFRNGGSGTFSLETANALPHTYVPATYAYDENGDQHLVFTPRYNQGLPTSLAIGDLDGDRDLDIVVGRDWYDLAYAYVDPYYVDFTQTPPYVTAYYAYYYLSYTFYYYTATKVFLNDLSANDGWEDASADRLPPAGDSNDVVRPALHARDLALGDIDGDGSLDIVLTWDDPLTVSPYGLYSGYDPATVATRVLVNDGNGDFSGGGGANTGDVTDTWLPAPSGNELWQAHRVALADLDGDSDLDIVLLHEQSIDAYAGTPTYAASALRVLRNDPGPGTQRRFTDVTSTAVPALPSDSDDNWRGGALVVTDVDGDGFLDLVVGTREVLRDDDGGRLRSTRILLGGAGLVFRRSDAFLPAASADSGEVDDLLVGDLPGSDGPVLLRLSEVAPAESSRDDFLRGADWKR